MIKLATINPQRDSATLLKGTEHIAKIKLVSGGKPKDEKQYQCDECEFLTNRAGRLNDHKLTKHGKKEDKGTKYFV